MPRRLTFIALASCLLLSACGAWQAVSDTSASAYRAVFYKQVKVLNVDLSARASINPDEASRPCSVSVRVYQLKDRKLFDAATYEDLLKRDKTVLGRVLNKLNASLLQNGRSTRVG